MLAANGAAPVQQAMTSDALWLAGARPDRGRGAPHCRVRGTTCHPRHGIRIRTAQQYGCHCRPCRTPVLSQGKPASSQYYHPKDCKRPFKGGLETKSGHSSISHSPQLLDKPVVQLFLPLGFQECGDRFAPREELLTHMPLAVCSRIVGLK